MYNYDDLEKIYYKRKIKKYLIYFLFILVVLSTVLYIFFIIDNKKHKTNKDHKNSTIIKNETNNSKKKNLNVIKSKVNITKNKNLIKLEKNSSKEIKKNVIDSKKKSSKLILDPIIPDINITNVSDSNSSTILNNKTKIVKKQVKKEIIKPKKPKLLIKISKEKNSLEYLLNNYKVFPEYETAIKIATIYFNKKDYKKSIEWAKKANNINAEDAESWLLYAKSLVKFKKVDEAKKLLNSYLEIYGSNQKVKQYLRSIK